MNPFEIIKRLLGSAYKGTNKTKLDFWDNDTQKKIEEENYKIKQSQKFNQTKEKILGTIADIYKYAVDADDLYYTLVANNLQNVPACDAHDESFVEAYYTLYDNINLLYYNNDDSFSQLKELSNNIPELATKIQTFLNEPTSDLNEAILWDAKFNKAMHDHLQFGNNDSDLTLSEVMRAFRNWQSQAQIAIDMFGSKRLINATYEAVIEGQDAMMYIQEILNLEMLSYEGVNYGKEIKVPHTGFFGESFFN